MIDGIETVEYGFESSAHKILPGAADYRCAVHDSDIKSGFSFYTDCGTITENVQIKDISVEENRVFNYSIMRPAGSRSAKKVIFFFHGFNEKDWKKYLPWAEALCKNTGRSIVLFPMAFHMQRAPKNWSDKREMFKLSGNRKKRYPNIVNSSLSNVAISMRLHSMPQRFVWSGLQTYYDVIQLITECREGRHPYIEKDFEFDIFAYSIGGFLSMILKLTDHRNYFSDSKVCMFCGGATFNRFSPVSKFILDSEANVALYSFLVEHVDRIMQKDKLLDHYINGDHPEGKVLHSMLDYHKMRDFRESLLKKYEDQFYAVTLKKDTVIPTVEVINTLKGAGRDISIRVDELDFDREYTHENPFPSAGSSGKQTDKDMELVFKKVSDFYNEY